MPNIISESLSYIDKFFSARKLVVAKILCYCGK